MHIKNIEEFHYPAVAQIYAEGLSTGIATYETEVPSWEAWDSSHLESCRLAIFDKEILQAWSALSPVSHRHAYRGVAELSIYVAEAARGKGLGKTLLQALIKESEKNSIWTLQSGIFKDNFASLQLHKNCGFRRIGFREKVAQRDGIWYDNVIMERRSKIVGI